MINSLLQESGPLANTIDRTIYSLPGACLRIAYHATTDTTKEDIERFFGHSTAAVIVIIERGWGRTLLETGLYECKILLELQPEKDLLLLV